MTDRSNRHFNLMAGAAVALLCLAACEVHTADVTTIKRADSLYRGQTANGKPNGLGALYVGDSLVYSGQWANGHRQGQGETHDSLGRHIIGTWADDTLVCGQRSDGSGFYNGSFDRHLRACGYGTFHDRYGTHYEGQWKDDQRTGFGFSSQDRYFKVGEWRNNIFRGERLNYTADRIYGIDLSKYQHETGRRRFAIDWTRLRIFNLGTLSKKNIQGTVDYKVSFIFIKSTEGTTVLNPYYTADYLAARKNGYTVGTYHFFSTRTSGALQARHFLKNLHLTADDLPPVLDVEPLAAQVTQMGGAKAMWQQVRAWLTAVERQTGMRPILYISQAFVNKYLDLAPDIKQDYPVWIARYGDYKPDVKLWIWQLAPDGQVTGIHGMVDINIFNGYEDEFRQWLQKVKKR